MTIALHPNKTVRKLFKMVATMATTCTKIGVKVCHQYIKILLVCPSVCLSVTDVGVAVTNCGSCAKSSRAFQLLRSPQLEMAIIILFLEIVKTAAKLLLQVWTLCVAGYAKDAIVGDYHRTSDGQDHKIIGRAGLERDTIFHLRVTACREQGSHCHD